MSFSYFDMQNRWDLSIRIFWPVSKSKHMVSYASESKLEFHLYAKKLRNLEPAYVSPSEQRRREANKGWSHMQGLPGFPWCRIIKDSVLDFHVNVWSTLNARNFNVCGITILSTCRWQDTINAQQRAKLFRFLFLSDTSFTAQPAAQKWCASLDWQMAGNTRSWR